MRWERRRRAIVPSSPCPAEVSFILERRKLGLDIKSCGRWQRKSVRFYWDNQVSRRSHPNTFTREQAIEKATALARAEIDKLDSPEDG